MKFPLLVSVFLLMARASAVDITVRGTEGGEAIITCPYPEGYEQSKKYFYKGFYRDNNLIFKSNGTQSSVIEDRFSLKDDHQRSFTVTIRDLQMTDTGLYTCAAGWGYSKSIQLNVFRAPQKPKPIQISTSTIQSDQAITPPSKTPPDLSTSDINPQSTVKTLTDHHVFSDSSVIVITVEALALLLIGLPLVILVMRKKRKTEGLLPSSIKEFNPELYEQIKANLADGDTQTTVLYSCVY